MSESTRHGTICAYCAEPRLTGNERPEHPIQAAIGSSWRVYTVCDPCNDWADTEIDQPFLRDPFILELRSEHDIRDHRHSRRAQPIGSPLLRGHTDDGLYVVADHEGRPEIRNSRIEEGPDGEFTIVAGSRAEYDRLLRKLQIRAALEGKTIESGEPTIGEVQPRVTGRMQVRPWCWRRALAKIALAAGSVAYDEAWRRSPDAALLREWMRDKDALPHDHCPFERIAGGRLARLVEPPHHAVFFEPADGAMIVNVVLFGDIAFKLPVDTTGRPRPQIAWYLDTRRPRANGETTWSRLLTNVTRGAAAA